MALAKRNSSWAYGSNALMPLTENGEDNDQTHDEGTFREKDHQQIETTIIKEPTIIIHSIYLAPLRYQTLYIYLFLPEL